MSKMVYSFNWLDVDVNLRKKIVFIIARTQKPLVITADPFYILNFESFLSVYMRHSLI